MDCIDRNKGAVASSSPERPYVLFSQADGLISEHQRAADARVAYLLYIRKNGPLAAEMTSVYFRSDAGWTRF
jgi:hypothetical protein